MKTRAVSAGWAKGCPRWVLLLRSARVVLPSLGVLVFSSWLLDTIKGDHVFEETFLRWLGVGWSNAVRFSVMTACGLTTLICSAALRRALSGWEPVQGSLVEAGEWPARMMILTLSPPGRFRFIGSSILDESGHQLLYLAGFADEDRGRMLDEWDCDQERRWPWVQVGRALRPHLPRLERVVLLGSQGAEGSARHMDSAISLLHTLAPGVLVEANLPCLDFEDIPRLYSTIARRARIALAEGFDAGDIVVDCTGGLKTASIAASLATIDSEIRFQYVETHPPYRVLAYQLRYLPAPG